MQPMTQRFTIDLRRLQNDSHDRCSVCGTRFDPQDTAHAGYGANGDPLYVGDCCAGQLAETAARFLWQPRAFEIPSPGSRLWRYMDFSKLVSLLIRKSLYFARADHLGDPFEGAKGILPRKSLWDDHYLRFFREAILNPPPGYKCELSSDEVQKKADDLLEQLATAGRNDLLTTFVSCWHENESESEALWRLYCPPPSAGVAVCTSYADLKKALGDSPDVQIGRVQYIDFRHGFAGPNEAIFRKRNSLAHEKEVRAVIRKGEPSKEIGIAVEVNLDVLIHRVVISPFAPLWFEAVLKEIMLLFGVNNTISASDLGLEPFY